MTPPMLKNFPWRIFSTTTARDCAAKTLMVSSGMMLTFELSLPFPVCGSPWHFWHERP